MYPTNLQLPRSRIGSLTICLIALLAGCAGAPITPTLPQLRAEGATRIVLIVEGNPPPRYSIPTLAEAPYVGGGTASILFGALGAQAVLSQDHAKLNAAASSRGIKTDHRQAWTDTLVKQLSAQGFEAITVSTNFERGTLGGDRTFQKPVRDEALLIADKAPAFFVNLDFGSCTAGIITPCVRAMLQPAGIATAPGPNQKYRGAGATAPDLMSKSLPAKPLSFSNADAAGIRIEEFDAALAALIPESVTRLVSNLNVIPVFPR